jgi:HlyD family secretion protein
VAVLVLSLACGGTVEVELVGTVELRTLEMATPVSEVIVDIPVTAGEQVAAGQVLVQMDSVVAEAELEASQAALAAAQASLTAAEQEHKRYQGLRRANVAAARQLDEARRVRDEALAAVAERKARIAQAKKRLDTLTIRTYAAGTVDQLPFDVGERVPGGGVVAVVLADEKPFVRVWLPARLVAGATRGSQAEIRIEGFDQPLAGHLEEVAREPEFTPHYALTERESAHLVYEARIVVDEPPEQLRPGLPARVVLTVGRSSEG